MEEINVVGMAIYKIEKEKENCKKAGILYTLSIEQLALLELNKEHDKAIELINVKDAEIIALKHEIKELKKYCIGLGGFFE